jgi:hypothetical protein
MSKFTFKNEDGDRVAQVEFDKVCLDEVLEEIVIFLKACGYTYLEDLVSVNATARPITYDHDDDEAISDC